MLIGVESSLIVTVQPDNFVDTGLNTSKLNNKIQLLVSGLNFAGNIDRSQAAKTIRDLVDQTVWGEYQGEQIGPN